MGKKFAALAAASLITGLCTAGSLVAADAFSTKVEWNEDGTKDVWYTYNTGAVHCVNNEVDSIDYKISWEEFEKAAQKLKNKYMPGLEKDMTESVFGSDRQQNTHDYSYLYDDADKLEKENAGSNDSELEMLDISVSEGERDDDDILKKAVGYLIQNDYWTPPGWLTWDPDEQVFSFQPRRDTWQKASKTFLKSDLVMMLSKIVYGVQRSKPLVWRGYTDIDDKKCFETGTLDVIQVPDAYDLVHDDNGDRYHYSATSVNGDIFVYWSPNVYELYINHAVKSGLVEKPEKWSGSVGNSGVQFCGSLQSSVGGGVLGSTIAVGSRKITERRPSFYGAKEHMTLLNALRLVENFMRVNDDDMSQAEEQIVRYKLNLYMLDDLDEEDKSTMTYLIAKGVVDYTNANLIGDLHKEAKYANLLPVVYRVANKKARLDFSEIQLTDSDKQWQAEGFYEQVMPVSECSQEPYCPASRVAGVSEVEEEAYSEQLSSLAFSQTAEKQRLFLFPISVSAKSTNKRNKKYEVVKTVDKVNTYTYKGVKVSKLFKLLQGSGSGKSEKIPKELDEIKEMTVEYNGSDLDVYELKFSIESSSERDAILAIDNTFKLKKIISGKKKMLSCVTRINTDSGEQITMVSQDSLKQSFSRISVLEDKVLLNTQTGAMAYLSEEQNFALVGNSVITSEYAVICSSKGGEVYYNLDVLLSIMPEAYVQYIGSAANIIVYDILAEKAVSYSTSLTNAVDNPLKAVYVKAAATETKTVGNEEDSLSGALEIMDDSYSLKKSEKVCHLIKLSSVSSGISMLSKDFSVQDGDDVYTGTVIVDWKYVVPSIDDFNASEWYEESVRSDSLTYQEAVTNLTTPPKDLNVSKNKTAVTSLQQWWESNYGMSNALCNFMYGTSGKSYVSSGYLAPSVTLLIDDRDFLSKNASVQNRILKCVFQDKVLLGDDYIKYNGGKQGAFWKTFYGFASLGSSGNVYPGLDMNVQSLAASERTFSVYTKTTKKKSNASKVGDCYGIKYFVSDSGAVYLNLASDKTRFSYRTDADGMIKALTINTRRQNVFRVGGNTSVKYGGTKLIYLATSNGTMNFLPSEVTSGGSTAAFATKGYVKYGKGGRIQYVPVDSGGEYPSDAEVRKLWLEKEGAITGEDPVTLLGSKRLASISGPQYLFGKSSRLQGLSNGDYIYDGKYVYQYSRESGELPDFDRVDDAGALKRMSRDRETVYGVFYYRFPVGSYFIAKTSNGPALCKGSVCASLNYVNVEYASLNSQLIESKLSDVQGIRSAGTLGKGMKLLIGDTVWVKSGDYWLSQPIKSGEAASRIITDGSADAAKSILFGTMPVKCSGIEYPLANYVKEISLGKAKGSKMVKKLGILCMQDGKSGMYVYKNGKYKPADIKTGVQYVSLAVSLDKELLVRPLDAAGSTWTVVYRANIGMESSDQYPFFDGGLSFSKSRQASTQITSSQFSPSAAFLSIKHKFTEEFHKVLLGDFWSLLWLVLLSTASYMIVMSWFCYGVLTMGVGRMGFEALAMRDSSGKKRGIDVIKIFTFGIYSLDSDPPLQRIVTVTFVCCGIIIFIVNNIVS